MRLNLDKQFVDLTGAPLPAKMDDTLANMLAMSTVGPPAKMVTWAVNLTNEGEIAIDKADLKFLKGFIEQHPGATNLAKAALLEELKKLENVQPLKCETNHVTVEDVEKDLMRKVNNVF